ncbi:hypothetical protein GOV14_02990 [Candidatus Pacearchaeota archaeon]|nr:hypothetical protein [Candidatus Pacearchaeota archaeon]
MVKIRELIKLFEKRYCNIVFFISLVLGFFLIPRRIFFSYLNPLAILFILTFALTLTCIARNIKEKIRLARTCAHSVIGIIISIVGISTFHVCTIGGVCATGFVMGIISVIFPSIMISFMQNYAISIIILSILIQLASLYFMHCFRKVKK